MDILNLYKGDPKGRLFKHSRLIKGYYGTYKRIKRPYSNPSKDVFFLKILFIP